MWCVGWEVVAVGEDEERAPVLDKGDLRPLDVDAAQELGDPLEAAQPVLKVEEGLGHPALEQRHARRAEQHVQPAPLGQRLGELEDAPRAGERRRPGPHPPRLRLALLRKQEGVRRRGPLAR